MNQTNQMPYEVATEMLCDRKTRQTNQFRKTLKRARELVYPSTARKANQVMKLAERLATLPLMKLEQLMKRAAKRRRQCQHAWEKTPVKMVLARQRLEERAAAFELLYDTTENEVNKRMTACLAKN